MALKTFKKIDKKGHEEIWEWEETPELRAFIKKQSITKLATPPTRPEQYAIIKELRGKTVRGNDKQFSASHTCECGEIGKHTRLKICRT